VITVRPWLARLPRFAAVLVLLGASSLPARAQDHDAHMPAAARGETADGPRLALHGFSDVTFRIENAKPEGASDSTTSGFTLGQFDLYFVSRLASGLSFLGETVFEVEPDGEWVVDVERVFIKYAWSDLFRVSAGRTHTALGYWNEAFHHGALLQPTVERPELLKFEDDGGILPVHAVGIEGAGEMHSGDWGIAYVGNIANGRASTRDAVQGETDANGDKALGVKLSLTLSGPQKLAVGPSFYRDLIPPDPATPGREGAITERIVGAHFYYSDRRCELLAEIYHLRHGDRATSAVNSHDAWYAIAVLNTGRLKPYAGVDRLDLSSGDPYLGPDAGDLTRSIVGLRFEPNPFNAVKLEFRNDRRPGERSNALLVQTAFTF
jgi:hypothetical protein